MTLERLVAEIEARGREELAREEARVESEAKRLAANRDLRLEAIRSESARQAASDAARERAQRIAAAKLQARKLEYEARERETARALDRVRTMLTEFTRSPDYGPVLKQMYAACAERLGNDVRIFGRAEDASLLRPLAGTRWGVEPTRILGGVIGETANGSRRLNLSFDELLRLREDRVRQRLRS